MTPTAATVASTSKPGELKLRLLESPYRTPQTLVGGPRFDAALGRLIRKEV